MMEKGSLENILSREGNLGWRCRELGLKGEECGGAEGEVEAEKNNGGASGKFVWFLNGFPFFQIYLQP